MAGGKLNARQKMINMMYLVLTALLALNVSKEILNAFVVINMGLLQQKESLNDKNNSVLNDFVNQKHIDSTNERLAFLNEKAIYVKGISDELSNYIEKMKLDLVVKVDDVDEAKAKEVVNNPVKVDRKDDYDGPTRYFGTDEAPGTTGTAHELKLKINDFRDKCMKLVDLVLDTNPRKAELRKEVAKKLAILQTEDPKDNKDYPTWEMQYFYHLPLSAALTELTKWQNFVKGAEGDMLNFLWAEISANAFKFDKVRVAVIPKSSFVTSGSNFEADVFLAAYSTNGSNIPTIIYGTGVDSTTNNVVGGVTLPKDQFNNGIGRVSFPVNGSGEKTFAGTLQLKDPSGNLKTFPFSTKYNVAPPTATVSPDMMNVFYYGLPNPVSISVPGVAQNNMIVSATGCTISGSNGKYNVSPTQRNGKAYVNVSARMEDGTTKPMGRYEFRIKEVPTPSLKWGSVKFTDRISASQTTQPLIPYMENFDFNIFPVVTSFSLFVKMADGGNIVDNNIQGNQIPSKYHSQLKSLKKGSKVYFDNVKMSVPGGTRTASFSWEIK